MAESSVVGDALKVGNSTENTIGNSLAETRARQFSLLSHDILSTLAEVVGGVRLLDPKLVDKLGQPQIGRILASGEALSRLLDGILQEDGSGDDAYRQDDEKVFLNSMLDDIGQRWSGMAQDKHLTFDIEKAAKLPAVLPLNRTMLDRILSNLIGNAIKHSDQGNVVLGVEVNDHKELSFEITDQGPGFSEQAFEHLFQYQGRPEITLNPGNGLGLHIAMNLSETLGGTLTATNTPNGGARVNLVFPENIWRTDDPQTQIVDYLSSELVAPDLSHLKILLAEDNPTTQMVTVQMLSSLGAEIRVTSDGEEALSAFEAEVFDVVLLDITMPKVSGLEVMKAIRAKKGEKAQTVIVALTAYIMREQRLEIYNAGCDGIMTKPLMRVEELGRGILEFYTKRARIDEEVPQAKNSRIESVGSTEGPVVELEIFENVVDIIGPDHTLELLEKLLEDTDSVYVGITKGKKLRDFEEVRLQTHILISVAGAIGATKLQAIAQTLNSAANRETTSQFDSLCDFCISGLAELQNFIKTEQSKAEYLPS